MFEQIWLMNMCNKCVTGILVGVFLYSSDLDVSSNVISITGLIRATETQCRVDRRGPWLTSVLFLNSLLIVVGGWGVTLPRYSVECLSAGGN